MPVNDGKELGLPPSMMGRLDGTELGNVDGDDDGWRKLGGSDAVGALDGLGEGAKDSALVDDGVAHVASLAGNNGIIRRRERRKKKKRSNDNNRLIIVIRVEPPPPRVLSIIVTEPSPQPRSERRGLGFCLTSRRLLCLFLR